VTVTNIGKKNTNCFLRIARGGKPAVVPPNFNMEFGSTSVFTLVDSQTIAIKCFGLTQKECCLGTTFQHADSGGTKLNVGCDPSVVVAAVEQIGAVRGPRRNVNIKNQGGVNDCLMHIVPTGKGAPRASQLKPGESANLVLQPNQTLQVKCQRRTAGGMCKGEVKVKVVR
jgi:hypothetical protein